MTKLLDFFPAGATPREQQIHALEKIQAIWDSGKKIAIGSLPTGIGKSHIAKTVGESTREIDPILKGYVEDYSIYRKNKAGDCVVADAFLDAESYGSFILTITKSLQDQYQNIFIDGSCMKGKNNYQCDVDDNFSVDFAPCDLSMKQRQRCFDENRCPYYKARNSGLVHRSPVLNYSMFLNLPDFLQKRQILILDEAAEFEDALVAQYSVSLNYKNLRYNGVFVTPISETEDPQIWLGGVYSNVKMEYDNLLAEAVQAANTGGHASVSSSIMGKIKKLGDMCNKIDLSLSNWKSCEFLLESSTKDDVTFAPYTVKPLARQIFNKADKILMMSATLSNVGEYTKALGINKDEYEYFEIASSFDPAKSPIICSRKFKLNYKTMDDTLPKLVSAAIKLCEQHGTENGLIHTHSHKITMEFKKQLGSNPRYLFREDGVTNKDIIDLHYGSNNATVLISPSLDTGISLDDDLGRFQIICKAPYLPLGSKRIARMFKETPDRYSMKMLDNIIQMAGRCTRSVDDYSITYILDATAVFAIERSAATLPKHFLNRFV